MDLLKPGRLSVATIVFQPLQALVTRWSYLRGLTTGDSFVEFKIPSENLANVQKRLSMTKSNFEKVAASRIVSLEFLGTALKISEDSSIWGQLYLKVAAHELFSCVLRTVQLFSFVYITTPKIFRIILSSLFVSLETVLLAILSWKLWDFRKLLTNRSSRFRALSRDHKKIFF